MLLGNLSSLANESESWQHHQQQLSELRTDLATRRCGAQRGVQMNTSE